MKVDNNLELSQHLMKISIWIDEHNVSDGSVSSMRLQRWQRCMKVAEELGEVTEVLIDLDNQNPRKESVKTENDLIKELIDVALTALCAVEHLTGNNGHAISQLKYHTRRIFMRAGI